MVEVCFPGFQPTKYSVLCSKHFDESLFNYTQRRKSNRRAHRLIDPINIDNLIPSILEHQNDSAITSDNENDEMCSLGNNSFNDSYVLTIEKGNLSSRQNSSVRRKLFETC